MQRAATLFALIAGAAACELDEYCCPDALHCLKATTRSCLKDANVCGKEETCCPLTKLCVTVGVPCTSHCSSNKTYCSAQGSRCVEPVSPGEPFCSGGCLHEGARCDFVTKLCVKETEEKCAAPRAGCEGNTSYCCPDVSKCLAPGASPVPCPDGTCKGGKTCCPLTKLCVDVGPSCTPLSVCRSDEYCCPDVSKCLRPINAGVLCSKDKPCPSYATCCPLTQECVAVGHDCSP